MNPLQFSLVGSMTATGVFLTKECRRGIVSEYGNANHNKWRGKYRIFLKYVGNASNIVPDDDGCIFVYYTENLYNTPEEAITACEAELKEKHINPWNPDIVILGK